MLCAHWKIWTKLVVKLWSKWSANTFTLAD